MADKWIAGATANAHGQFRAKAEAAGKTTREFAAEKAGAPGKTGEQARLAKTLMGMHKSKGGSAVHEAKEDRLIKGLESLHSDGVKGASMGAMVSKQAPDVAKGNRQKFDGKGHGNNPAFPFKQGSGNEEHADKANPKFIGAAKDGAQVGVDGMSHNMGMKKAASGAHIGSGGFETKSEQKGTPPTGQEKRSSGQKIQAGLEKMAAGGMIVKTARGGVIKKAAYGASSENMGKGNKSGAGDKPYFNRD